MRSTHPDAPREFLYYHSIELFMKAFLRNAGLTVLNLRTMSHSTGKLREAFEKHGGILSDRDGDVLTIMEITDAVARSRYLATGLQQVPPMELLAKTAENLNDIVRARLKASGLPVR